MVICSFANGNFILSWPYGHALQWILVVINMNLLFGHIMKRDDEGLKRLIVVGNTVYVCCVCVNRV